MELYPKTLAEHVILRDGSNLNLIRSTYSGNLDECTEIGCHWTDFSKDTNAPYTSGYGEIIVEKSGTTLIQRIYRHTTAGVSEECVRIFVNNQWYPYGITKFTPDGELGEKRYTGSNSTTGTTVTALVQGKVVGIRVRGTTPNTLASSAGYVTVGTIQALTSLMTKGNVIKYAILCKGIMGQLLIDASTGQIRIGYTYDLTGEALNIASGKAFYIDETITLQ